MRISRDIVSPSLRKQEAAGELHPTSPMVLYRAEGAELQSAISWLKTAKDPVLLRLSGGCLGMSVKHHSALAVITDTFINLSLDGYYFRGVALHGGSQSVLRSAPSVVRPCFPDIAPILERCLPDARFLGVFPGQRAEELPTGGVRICSDKLGNAEWDIIANPYQQRAMFNGKKTDYLWDAEWQQCLELERRLHSQRPLATALYLFFDGRRGVANEIKAVAEQSLEDPKKKLLLITGGDPSSAPDMFAKNDAWLRAHPNVQTVPAREAPLRQCLLDLGVLAQAPAFSTASAAEARRKAG